MKKQLHLCFLLLTAFSIAVSAQVTFGVQGTYNYSFNPARTTINEPPEKITGFSPSFQLYYRIGPHFRIGTEPGMAMRGGVEQDALILIRTSTIIDFIVFPAEVGGSIDFINPPQTIPSKAYLNFFQLPFLVKVDGPLLDKGLSFYLKTGVGPSWLTSADMVVEGRAKSTKISGSRWEVGLFNGAGVELDLGPGQATLGMESYLGLMRLRYGKSRSFGFSLGYVVRAW